MVISSMAAILLPYFSKNILRFYDCNLQALKSWIYLRSFQIPI